MARVNNYKHHREKFHKDNNLRFFPWCMKSCKMRALLLFFNNKRDNEKIPIDVKTGKVFTRQTLLLLIIVFIIKWKVFFVRLYTAQ